MSQPNDIPDEVLEFISRRIDSVPHLEALLLLWEDTSREWSYEAVAARIYVSRERAGAVLAELALHGLIVPTDSDRFCYKFDVSWDTSKIMPKLSNAYRRHLVNVASLIHSKSSSEAVRQFAKAFQMNKKG